MEAAKRTVVNARRLRKEMTPPEVRLWGVLRRRAMSDLRFRRQHPIGPFILDFYCDSAKLAIEVDGDFHGIGDQPARDARREGWLAEHGVETLRIPAVEIRDNLDGVFSDILRAARERLGR
jgi:very-short-patch-repair endonuclease